MLYRPYVCLRICRKCEIVCTDEITDQCNKSFQTDERRKRFYACLLGEDIIMLNTNPSVLEVDVTIFKNNGIKEAAVKQRFKHTAMFGAISDIKGRRCFTTVDDLASHAFSESLNDADDLYKMSGLSIYLRTCHRPCLLTESNALLRSVKTMYTSTFCSLHFSWIWLAAKIIIMTTT